MKKPFKLLKRCKICNNENLITVLTLNEQYLSPTFVKSNSNNYLSNVKFPLNLVLCDTKNNKNACGLLQLKEITKADLLYDQYFYRSGTNDMMKKDLNDVVNSCLSLVNPKKGETIVDIGANDCTLLNFYGNQFNLIGFEPAKNIKFINDENNIRIINNYFNFDDFQKNFKNVKAKIITSCAMFYDLENPKTFVRDIEKILDNEGVWCCQISYLASMIKFNNFYDICHEHLSYYSLETFESLINKFNLKCFLAETNDVNGGSIRIYVCKKNNMKFQTKSNLKKLDLLRIKEKKLNLKKISTYTAYKKIIDNLKSKTNLFINEILSRNKKVFALGASTKGNIILQHFGLSKEKIPYISERNSEKIGLKCLGSDIELISETRARELNPEAFIVLPWNFKKEIVEREKKYLKNGGKLFFIMPYPHIVTLSGETKI
jgi:ribosomal protein L9